MKVFVEPVGEFNFLQIRITDENGNNHRYFKRPDDDFAGEPLEVMTARDEFHTPEVLARYQSWNEEQLPPIQQAGPRRIGTPREFLHLFTEAEKAAFFAAKASNIQLELWWAEASTGDFSLDHPSVEAGLGALAGVGILSHSRVVEILEADFNAT